MGFNNGVESIAGRFQDFGKGFVDTVDTISHQFDNSVATVNNAAVQADKQKSIAAPFISAASDILNALDLAQKSVVQPVFDQAKKAIQTSEAIKPAQQKQAQTADIMPPSNKPQMAAVPPPIAQAEFTPGFGGMPIDFGGDAPNAIEPVEEPQPSRFLAT